MENKRSTVLSLSGGMDSSTLLLRCIKEYDNVIAGIGQAADIPAKFDVVINRGNIKVNDCTLETNRKGVFAGGDIATGPASVIGAIAQGR